MKRKKQSGRGFDHAFVLKMAWLFVLLFLFPKLLMYPLPKPILFYLGVVYGASLTLVFLQIAGLKDELEAMKKGGR